MQFVVNVPEMPPDCAVGQTDASGDFLVGKPRSQQFEDFSFARGKAFDLRRAIRRMSGAKNCSR
jgi:hypothetical protein